MDEQGRQVVRDQITVLLGHHQPEELGKAWAQAIEEEAYFQAAQDEPRYFELISQRLAALVATHSGTTPTAQPGTEEAASGTTEGQGTPQTKKKKTLGRRPNPKRPDKVPIAFILPAPRGPSTTGVRDSAVPRDLWVQTLQGYTAPLDNLIAKTRARLEAAGHNGPAAGQQLLQQMQFARHTLHTILACGGPAQSNPHNEKLLSDLQNKITEWLLWDLSGSPFLPPLATATPALSTTTSLSSTTTTTTMPSGPATRKRRASADDTRVSRRTTRPRTKGGSSPSSPGPSDEPSQSTSSGCVPGLFPFHTLPVEAEEGKLASEGRISPRCSGPKDAQASAASSSAATPRGSGSPPSAAIRSPTSAFSPWGGARRGGARRGTDEDELSAATAIEALASAAGGRAGQATSASVSVKDEPVESEAEDEGVDGDEENEPVSPPSSKRPRGSSKASGPEAKDKAKVRSSKRRLKTPQQLEVLESEYAISRFPNTAKRQAISVATGLTPRGVQIWFQNKRAKDKFFESSAQKYMAKREGVPLVAAMPSGSYPALLPTPPEGPHAQTRLSPPPPPRSMSLPLPESGGVTTTTTTPLLPPLYSLSPPRPRPRAASLASSPLAPLSTSNNFRPLLPPISALPNFPSLHSSFVSEPETGMTSSSRSSSPLSSCPFNLVNVPPNLSSSPSVSRSTSPVFQPQSSSSSSATTSSAPVVDINTLISSLNSTIHFLTGLHSIAPSSQTSTPVCAWQGELTWQGVVPVTTGLDPATSGSALPQLYSCVVPVPLVCLASDRNCISVMERCPARMSITSMHPRGNRAYESVIEASEQAGTLLEFMAASEGARESTAFLLGQLQAGQAAIVNIDSRHQLVLFAAQGRVVGCLANVASLPVPLGGK